MNTLRILSQLNKVSGTGTLPGPAKSVRLADGVFLAADGEARQVIRIQRENRIYTSLPVFKFYKEWYPVDNMVFIVKSFVRWVHQKEGEYDLHRRLQWPQVERNKRNSPASGRYDLRYTLQSYIA